MTRAVLGVFPSASIETLLEELSAAGVERESLSVAVAHDDRTAARVLRSFHGFHELRGEGAGKLDGAGRVAERAERSNEGLDGDTASSSLIRAITREGIPEIVARTYVSELEKGGAFVSARVAGARVGKVVALMNRHTGRTVATAGDEQADDTPSTPPPVR